MKHSSNTVIHIGDFHYIKENFKVIGKLIRSSGFEDIIYQSGVCTSGSLEGMLGGSHYNRAWCVHQPMLEALERLLYERFIQEEKPHISSEMKELSVEISGSSSGLIDTFALHANEYDNFKSMVRKGSLGKTAVFCLFYMDTMYLQHQAHISVQENNFYDRLRTLKRFIPYYFYFNFQNYALYVSYYVEVLEKIDKLYPGLKARLTSTGLSVQRIVSFKNIY